MFGLSWFQFGALLLVVAVLLTFTHSAVFGIKAPLKGLWGPTIITLMSAGIICMSTSFLVFVWKNAP